MGRKGIHRHSTRASTKRKLVLVHKNTGETIEERHNIGFTGLLGNVAGQILIDNNLGHSNGWWDDNDGEEGHGSHNYSALNEINDITVNQVHEWQLNEIERLQSLRFKEAELYLKRIGAKDMNNFIKLANAGKDSNHIDFKKITSNIFDNLADSKRKISHEEMTASAQSKLNTLNDVLDRFQKISLNLQYIDKGLLKDDSTTLKFFKTIEEESKSISEALKSENAKSVDNVLKELQYLIGKQGPMSRLQGETLEELATARLVVLRDKQINKVSKKMRQLGTPQIVNSSHSTFQGKTDSTDIRTWLDDIDQTVQNVKIQIPQIDNTISKTASSINIQAKSGGNQQVWNSSISKNKKTGKLELHNTITKDDLDYIPSIGTHQIKEYFDLLYTLKTSEGDPWDDISDKSSYYDLLAAAGLINKMERILKLTENYNTILVTQAGFETYYSWFERQFKRNRRIMKLAGSINLSDMSTSGKNYVVVSGKIVLGSKK